MTRGGLLRGSTMRAKICNRFAPSRSAASSSSRGSPRKNCRKKKTPNAPAAPLPPSSTRKRSTGHSDSVRSMEHGLGALPDIETHLLLTVRRDGNEKVKACWRFGTPCRIHCHKLHIAPSSTPSPPPIRLTFVSLPTPSKGRANGPFRVTWRLTSWRSSFGSSANRALRRSSNPSRHSRSTFATTKASSAFRSGWFSSVSNSLVGSLLLPTK